MNLFDSAYNKAASTPQRLYNVKCRTCGHVWDSPSDERKQQCWTCHRNEQKEKGDGQG